MSGGRSARFGFFFSDLHIIRRVLEYLIQRRAAQIEGRAPPPLRTFQVESAIGPEGAPSWDILDQADGHPLIIEEVKSGPLSAEDRRTLWKRIRRTVTRLDQAGVARIIPRLTANRDNPTSHSEYWASLPTLIGSASGTSMPGEVRSAKTLAQEALYWLTHDEGEVDASGNSIKLTQERAKEVLSLFEFQDSLGGNTLENEVEQLVGRLSFTLGVKEVCNELLGDIYRRSSAQDNTFLRFTPEEIESALHSLQRLSEISPENARIWQEWRDLPESIERLDGTPDISGGLAYQDWHEVQPTVAATLAGGLPPLLALVGRGGMGKSVLLAKLREESQNVGTRTLWLTGDSLHGRNSEQVAQVLSLGAWATSTEGRVLRVFIDGFENAADDNAGLKDLIASLSTIDGAANISLAVTARASTWSELSGTQEKLRRWSQVELLDWDEKRVAKLVRASQRPRLGTELLHLLRTPLLLDLFLRTFGITEVIPEGLQTRHGVLCAYWERRVLPMSRSEAVARTEKLMQCCAREAEGHQLHVIAGPAMQQLFSEGLFVQQQGAWRFRHPLLRDFALMHWSVMAGQTAPGIIGILASIGPSLARWGAMRAMIEAASDMSPAKWAIVPPIEELVGAIRHDEALLMRAAEVLGELDAPSSINIEGILAAIDSRELATTFVNRLLDLARLSWNEGWLRWLASLPAGSEWPTRTPWVGDNFLVRVRELLTNVWQGIGAQKSSQLAPIANAVALRLRNWSSSQKFSNLLEQGDGFHWFHLMPLVSEHVPTQSTLDWLSSHVNHTWRTRWGVLESLPVLVTRARATGNTLDGPTIVELYRQAAGLARDSFGLRNDSGATSFQINEHERTSVALLGHDSGTKLGLLRAAPELFLLVAFDMLSGLAEDERNRREERWAHIENKSEAFAALFRPLQPLPEEAEIESRLPSQISQMEALGNLIDDSEGEHYWSTDNERSEIINALENMIRDALNDEESTFIERTYWPAAKVSRSAVSWLLLLDLLAANPTRSPSVLDELIVLRPFYHLSPARPYLHEAIAERWPQIDDTTKRTILSHIESVARSPSVNGLYCVAPLASAIPPNERPAWVEPYFELHRLRGCNPIPRRPESEPQVIYGKHQAQEEESSNTDMSPWAKVGQWASGRLGTQEDTLGQAILDLKTALATELPLPTETVPKPQVLHTLLQIFEQLAQRSWQEETMLPELLIEEPHVRRLTQWGFEFAKACSTQDLDADPTHIKVSRPPSVGLSHSWVLAIEFLNAVLLHPTVKEDLSLNRQLFEEIERRSSQPSPTLAWYIFESVNSWHWVRSGSNGRSLLRQFLFEKVRDPGAVAMAFHHVWYLGASERERLFRSWLTAPEALISEGDVEGFAAEVGKCLGSVAFHQEEGEPNNLRRLTDELLASPPSAGLLSRVALYRNWSISVAFGAKEQLLEELSVVSIEKMRDFGLLMNAIWSHVGGQPPAKDGARFVLFMLHPLKTFLSNSKEAITAARSLWNYLQPLVERVVREGLETEVFSLVNGLKKPEIIQALGGQKFSGFVDALNARIGQLGLLLHEPPSEPGFSWLTIYENASEMLAALAQAPDASSALRDKLHAILQAWADLEIPNATEQARAIRGTGF